MAAARPSSPPPEIIELAKALARAEVARQFARIRGTEKARHADETPPRITAGR
jgi:hypothetical protein